MTKKVINDDDSNQNEVIRVMPTTTFAQDLCTNRKNQTIMRTTAVTEEVSTTSSLVIRTPLLHELKLVPVMMFPRQVSRATEIRQFLSSIEFIAIHDVIEREDSIIYYVLDVYRYHLQKGLPSTRCNNVATRQLPHKRPVAHELKNRKPDYQIEQCYSSFARLRSNVAHIARKHHPHYKTCAYCSSLLQFLHVTPSKPCLKVNFTTTAEERKPILSSFINELVLATRENYALCPRSLRGYHIVPALVQRFLLKQTGESFFS